MIKEMFKGIVNSPEAVTRGALTTTSTQVELSDGAIFNGLILPTLATLGTNDTAETVKVTAINNNTITIERAFEGTAKSWASGTIINRNFTAYDYNTLVDNVTELEVTKAKQSDLNTTNANIDLKADKTIVNQLSNPNLLINGDFQVWQSGATFNNLQSNKYTADRFNVFTNILSGVNVSKTSDGYLKYDVPAITGVTSLQYIMEVPQSIKGKQCTISCKIKSNINCNLSLVVIKYETLATVYYSKPYISKIDEQTVTYTFIMPDVNLIRFWFARTENLTQATSLYIKDCKLELGSVATPFVPRLYGEELSLCKRYYRITPFSTGSGHLGDGNYIAFAQSYLDMRVPPSAHVVDEAGNTGKVSMYVSGASDHNKQASVLVDKNTTRVLFALPNIASGMGGTLYEDAEIY